MSGNVEHDHVGRPARRAGNKFWVVFVFMFIIWAFELLGLDKLKWVMRAIIYTPIVGTVVAFISGRRSTADRVQRGLRGRQGR